MSETAAAELAYLSRALKAPRLRAVSGRLAERARDEGWDYEAYLAAVLTEEVTARDSHGGSARGQEEPKVPLGKCSASPPSRPSTTSTSRSRRRSAARSSPTSPSSISSPRHRTWCSWDPRGPARPTCRSPSGFRPPDGGTGSPSPPPTSGSTGWAPPSGRDGSTRSSSVWDASPSSSSTRWGTSRSTPRPRRCSSPSSARGTSGGA